MKRNIEAIHEKIDNIKLDMIDIGGEIRCIENLKDKVSKLENGDCQSIVVNVYSKNEGCVSLEPSLSSEIKRDIVSLIITELKDRIEEEQSTIDKLYDKIEGQLK